MENWILNCNQNDIVISTKIQLSRNIEKVPFLEKLTVADGRKNVEKVYSSIKDKLESTVGKLKGNLHLILGNHDYKFRENKDFLKYFKSVDELRLIRDHNKWVQLCHYPILLWYRKNKGAYHIFGHMHNDSCTKEFHHIKKENNIFNCCVEINNFEPCTLDELIENNNKFYEKMTKSTE